MQTSNPMNKNRGQSNPINSYNWIYIRDTKEL